MNGDFKLIFQKYSSPGYPVGLLNIQNGNIGGGPWKMQRNSSIKYRKWKMFTTN